MESLAYVFLGVEVATLICSYPLYVNELVRFFPEERFQGREITMKALNAQGRVERMP